MQKEVNAIKDNAFTSNTDTRSKEMQYPKLPSYALRPNPKPKTNAEQCG